MFFCVDFEANVKVGLFVVVDAGVVGVGVGVVVTWMQFPFLRRAGEQIDRFTFIAEIGESGGTI